MTPEERALEAAWKICSAWDGKITKPVLRKAIEAALKEIEGSGEPVGEIVAASTPAAELLYGRDVRFYEAMRTLPIGTKLYAALSPQETQS